MAHAPFSSEHWKVTAVLVLVQAKVFVELLVGFRGLVVITGAGGATVATLQDRVVATLELPAASTARRARVWAPWVRDE